MSYYTRLYAFAERTLARGSEVKAEFDNIQTGLATLPSAATIAAGKVTVASCLGVVNAYVLTGNPLVTTYTDMLEVVFTAIFTNTDTCTVNFNGIGVVPLKMSDNAPTLPGVVTTVLPTVARYSANTGAFHVMSANSGTVSATSAATSAASALASANAATAASMMIVRTITNIPFERVQRRSRFFTN